VVAVSSLRTPPASRIGPYRLISKLGSGGFATVWLAVHERTDREVALKVLHRTLAERPSDGGPTVAERFVEEARLLQRLQIPGLVRVWDIIEDERTGDIAFAMERLSGRDLSAALPDLSLAEIVSVFAQVTETLAELHDRGVLHRDVKPSNIFLCDTATAGSDVKLLDLGVAKSLMPDPEIDATGVGVVVGSVHGLAPECVHRLLGEHAELTPAVDQWSVGVCLYQALSGRPPFARESTWAVLQSICVETFHDVPVRPKFGASSEVEKLVQVILRCLKTDPRHRFASTAELAYSLSRLADRLEPLDDLELATEIVFVPPPRAGRVTPVDPNWFGARVEPLCRGDTEADPTEPEDEPPLLPRIASTRCDSTVVRERAWSPQLLSRPVVEVPCLAVAPDGGCVDVETVSSQPLAPVLAAVATTSLALGLLVGWIIQIV